ncbi:MAG: hypothetical protein A2X49_11500 [Lentisphaerae bacterium GWF2_52_8]|nr:MAG: hypothetical protein A2X49_11500 [Lentisphaerae bacterium GWF2_52_8]
MSKQLEVWEGEFGKAYTDRNNVDWRQRLNAFTRMLANNEIKSVLEVGCNKGHNLVAISKVLGPESELVGLEPNRYAMDIAKQTCPGISFMHGNALDIPFKDDFFDLVFTSTVLIHISLEDLPFVMSEIHRTSRRYILAIEYFAEEETPIHYRGNDELLWKRDFLKHYKTLFPKLSLRDSGYWDANDRFDRTHWYLLEKPRTEQ